MAIAYGVGPATGINAASGGSTGDSTLASALPASWAVDQFAILAIWLDQGAASTPTNWNPAPGNPYGSGTTKLYLFWKFLVTGETTPVNSTITGSVALASNVGVIRTYSGVDRELPIEVYSAAVTGAGSPATALSVITLSSDAWVVFICGRGDNDNTWTTLTIGGSATGVVSRGISGSSAGNDSEVGWFDKPVAGAPAASGAASAAVAITDPRDSILISLREVQTKVVILSDDSIPG